MKELFYKYRDVIPYAIFGVLTTVVNIFVYWVVAHCFHMNVMTATVIAWVAAVLFAYLTNRKWVFHSSAETANEIAKEVIAFFSCRLATGVLDWLCMFLFVDILCWNDMVVKAAANILVIVLNYVASKLVIFKSK